MTFPFFIIIISKFYLLMANIIINIGHNIYDIIVRF